MGRGPGTTSKPCVGSPTHLISTSLSPQSIIARVDGGWWVAGLRGAPVLWRKGNRAAYGAQGGRAIESGPGRGHSDIRPRRDAAEAMHDFSRFSLSNMVESGTVLRSLGDGAGSMEEVAGRIVKAIDDWFRIPGTGEPACALVRLFKTHPYQDLPVELQTIAREQMAPASPSPETRCLTLLGTTGLLPEWRTPSRSKGHRVISLPSVEVMARFPMIIQLVRQLGLEVGSMLHRSPTLLVDREQRTFNVFHVPEAVGSPDIPAQAEFVIPHGVRSVLGFGGMLPGRDLFAVILFSRVPDPAGHGRALPAAGPLREDRPVAVRQRPGLRGATPRRPRGPHRSSARPRPRPHESRRWSNCWRWPSRRSWSSPPSWSRPWPRRGTCSNRRPTPS